MASKRSLDSFLEHVFLESDHSESGDSSGSDDSEPKNKKRKILSSNVNTQNKNELHIIHIGPFDLNTSHSDIRRLVFINKLQMPCDICLQIKNRQIFTFIAYKTFSEAQQTIHSINNNKNKSIKVCELITHNCNTYSQSLYDRSSFANKTKFVHLFGLKRHSNTLSNKDEQNWIKRLLKWGFTDLDFNILSVKVCHNVRYPSMNGFAVIKMENTEMTQKLVTHFQTKWINDQKFKYWIDFAKPNLGNVNERKCEQSTKVLLFENLYWKTNKSVLTKHICSVLNNDSNLEIIKNICVNATANGYPKGSALVECKSIKDSELVQRLCDGTELFQQRVCANFCKENTTKVCSEELKDEIDSDIESENDLLTQIHSQTDSDSESQSESDSESGSETDSDSESERGTNPKVMHLKDSEIIGLWKWKNPNRKVPNGLLCKGKRRFTGKYRKNWRELRRKDWLREWNKKERIAAQDKFWIRSGKLVLASKRWRDRAGKKVQKVKRKK